MEIYIASTILIIFIVFVVIPSIISMVTGESNYVKSLFAGVIFTVYVVGIIAAIIAVLWSAFYVLSYSVT
jgi:hypothetical protein